jgi:hypothetical protein
MQYYGNWCCQLMALPTGIGGWAPQLKVKNLINYQDKENRSFLLELAL